MTEKSMKQIIGYLLIALAILLPLISIGSGLSLATITLSADKLNIPIDSELTITYNHIPSSSNKRILCMGGEGFVGTYKYPSPQHFPDRIEPWESTYGYCTAAFTGSKTESISVITPFTPKIYKYYMIEYKWTIWSNIPNDWKRYGYDARPPTFSYYVDINVTEAPIQTHTLTIKVIDQNNIPLSGVEVSADNTDILLETTDSTGVITKSGITGIYTIIATKEGYSSASQSVDLTSSDQTITLKLTKIVTPTPTATPTTSPTTTPTTGPTAGPTATPILTKYLNLKFVDEDNKVISNVKVMVDGTEYISNNNGEVSIIVKSKEEFSVIATKAGYNRFTSTYQLLDTTSKTIILKEASGNYFINLIIGEDNIFYDENKPLGIPTWMYFVSIPFIGIGIFLMRKP